jgi:outer membrane protein insertion porin family
VKRSILVSIGLLIGAVAPWGVAAESPDSAAVAPPVRLERWVLEGDHLLDEDDAVAILPWAEGDSLPADGPQAAAETLHQRLVAAGWWDATVTPSVRADEEDAGVVVTLRLDAGEPVVVGEIGVRGNVLLTREEILAQMDLREGKTFAEAKFRTDVARILRTYSEKGYALARVYPSHFRRTDDGRLSFVVRISEGPRTEIESVRVFGETSTSQQVISRIAGVRPGDTWNVKKIERMSGRLRREGLFTYVGEPRIVRGSRDSRVGIEIELEEGPSSSFFGVLGYNPTPEGGGEIVGQVDVQLHNILGTARKAEIRFARQAADVQDISFRYREPWVLGSPITVELGAAQERRETLYSRTDLDVAVSGPIGEHSTGILAAERRESSFDDFEGNRVSETSSGGSAGLAVDVRDRRVNPGRGGAAGVRVGGRQTESGELRTWLEGDGHLLVPLGRRWVVSEQAGYRGVRSTGPEVPLYEEFFLGGTNTVRGYREDQFHGERVWWLRNELRYRLSLRSRAYGFADVGGFRFEASLAGGVRETVRDVIMGGGFGLSLETAKSGLVKFEFALGRGDGFSDAKVHVGLEQEF